jgi:voltage-gated potassium channel
MVAIEADAPGANITTASDGLWYTIVTISTVGYGDQYPVTNLGRLMGSFIIVVGVGIFGTFTGYLANLFLSAPDPTEPPPEPSSDAAVAAEETAAADLLREQVRQLRELLGQQQESIDEFERLLETNGA